MTGMIQKIHTLGNQYSRWLNVAFAILAIAIGIGLAVAILFGDSILLLIGFIVVIPITVLFFFRPDLGLYVHVLIAYTSLSGIAITHYGAPSLTKFFVPYLLGVVFLRWFIWQESPTKGWQQILTLFFAYVIFQMLSLLYAPDIDAVIDVLDNLTKNIAIALVIILLMQSVKNFRYVIWILVLSALFICLANTHQGLTGNFANEYGGFAQPGGEADVSGEEDAVRIAGPIGEPNFFALSIVMIFPFAVGIMVIEDRLMLRLIAASCTVFILTTAILTYSRGAVLSIIAILIVMLFFQSFRKVALLLIIAGIFVTPFFAPEGYFDRILTISSLLEEQPQALEDRSLRGRSSENKVAIDMFLDNIVGGVGVGNYNYHYQGYSENYGLDTRRTQRSAHSLYLEIASEQGLVGLTMFSVLLFYVFKSIFAARRIYINADKRQFANLCTATFIAFVGYLTGSMFLHDSYPRYFWLLVGIALSLQSVAIQYRQTIQIENSQPYLEPS